MSLPTEPSEEILSDVEPYNKLPNEYGETPEGYVPAYVTVTPESVTHVSEKGLRITDNQMKMKLPDMETLLENMRPPHIPVSRTNCVYAYPDIPTEENTLTSLNTGVLLEIVIDPDKTFVADALWIPYIAQVERHPQGKTLDVEVAPSEISEATKSAKLYWEGVIPYKSWLKLDQTEKNRYRNPELLISQDVPLKHMRRLN